MISWKKSALDAVFEIEKCTNVSKKITNRVNNIIKSACPHCSVLYNKYDIRCNDKALAVSYLADESGIVLYHNFNKLFHDGCLDEKINKKSCVEFIIKIGEDNKIYCIANIFKNNKIIKTDIYNQNSIYSFINQTFDDYYNNNCENISIIIN